MADFIDELLVLRNSFYLGSWQQVIDEASDPSKAPRTDEAQLQQRVLLYRAYVAQGKPERAIAEIRDGDAPELRVVKCLARYVKAASSQNTSDKSKAVQDITTLAAEGTNGLSSTVQVLVGSVLYAEERYPEALKAAVQSPRNLECVALAIQTYLKMDRPELARKEIEKLKTWADDATLAQLAEAWVNCYIGGDEKILESQYIFEELASSKLSTGRLVVGQAICKMQAGNFAEAERLLLEALSRYASDPDVIANLIVCATATGKSAEILSRYTSQLRQVAPQHPLLLDLVLKESLFDRAVQRYV
ncbi:hypothetical protein SpCBS45565_g02987 [Spizellomyces sp. 'palustris']|nr:hypothetical protein SpCBS45565_g02987 [Spizellomyces sp. 'palustris']